MAIWKRKLKKKESVEHSQKEGVPEETGGSSQPVGTGEEILAKEQTIEQPKEKEPVSEKPSEEKFSEFTEDFVPGGVLIFDKKISGFFGKGFWGILSVLIFPPVLVFALSIVVIVCMLVFPLIAIVLVALIPAVFVTLSILIIALPVFFPLLILFLLITGKGRLLLGSEGKWFGIEMFGKSYTLK